MGLVYHDKVKSILLHRVALVRPFAMFLDDIGAPVERGFRQAGLPYCALESVDNFVPSQRFWSFLVNMAYSQGIEDLGFRVGQRFGAGSFDPHMKNLLRRSPTLYQGLLKASELSNTTISHCRVGILQPECSSYALFYHKPSCDTNNPAIEQIGWFGLLSLIGAVRVFTGPQWQPAEIGIMTDHTPCRYIREQFPDARIRLQQPYSYIALENSLLSLPPPPPPDEASAPASSPLHYDPLPDNFADTLEQVMLAYIQEPDLSIEFAAGVCNTSKRTLQRKLTEMGTHYSELLAHARYRTACRMLQAPGLRVKDIAQRLGYSDSAHFARAFKQIAGVTPRAYRQQFIH